MLTSIILVFYLMVLSISVNGQDIKSANECKSTEDLPWSYSRANKNGPQTWKDRDKVCNYNNEDQRQSPINLKDNKKDDKDKDKIDYQFIGYDRPMTGMIRNTGANLVFCPNDCEERYIVVNDERCNLRNIVFHFGSKSSVGSNHKFNGLQKSLEVDIFNQCESGDAVIGILFQEVDKPTPRVQGMGDAVELVPNRGDSKQTKTPISLLNMTLPECYNKENSGNPFGKNEFFVYSGSYMFPPCTENATWIVQRNPSEVSKDIMTSFRALRATKKDSEEECTLYPNTRFIAPLGDRTVNQVISECGQAAGFIDQAAGMAFGCNSMTGVDAPDAPDTPDTPDAPDTPDVPGGPVGPGGPPSGGRSASYPAK